MKHDEARRRLEASTGFSLRGGMVWLREVRWLRAVEELRCEDAAGTRVIVRPCGYPASSRRSTVSGP